MNKSLEKKPPGDFSLWSLTISPRYHTGQSNTIWHKIYTRAIVKCLNRFSHRYAIYPEYARNNRNEGEFRLHYHGTVEVDDFISFTKKNYLLEKLGFVKWKKLNKVSDLLKWNIYCLKEYPITKHTLKVIRYIRLRRLPLLVKQKPTHRCRPNCKVCKKVEQSYSIKPLTHYFELSKYT